MYGKRSADSTTGTRKDKKNPKLGRGVSLANAIAGPFDPPEAEVLRLAGILATTVPEFRLAPTPVDKRQAKKDGTASVLKTRSYDGMTAIEIQVMNTLSVPDLPVTEPPAVTALAVVVPPPTPPVSPVPEEESAATAPVTEEEEPTAIAPVTEVEVRRSKRKRDAQ